MRKQLFIQWWETFNTVNTSHRNNCSGKFVQRIVDNLVLHKRILNKDRDTLLYNNTDMILLQLGMGVKSDTIFYFYIIM